MRIAELFDAHRPQRFGAEDDDESMLVDRAAPEVEPRTAVTATIRRDGPRGLCKSVREELDEQNLPGEGLQAASLVTSG